MKVLMINGSPRKNGNTSIALEEMKKVFEAEKIDAEIVQVGNKEVRGCIACGRCAELGKCVFDDVVNELAPKFEEADGLVEVKNPSEYMLNGRPEGASGSVVACSMEGTRPILIEIQALVCHSNFGIPRRTAAGCDFNRVNLLMAVLEKRARINLSTSDAYVNIAGGIKMNEPAIDLGITLAVVSSYKDQVIDEKTVVFGEVGLSGEVRAVSMAEQRVLEAKKLGFERVILPAVCMKSVEKIGGIALIPVENIQDAILRVGKN